MAKKKGTKKNVKKVPAVKISSITDSINTEIIAAALSSVNQTILLKVCRLCETKDGPFLNIFDADKITAKKIESVMPFRIEEHDDLPHKICFRCSAKVEELYEFIQKCTNTQKSLRKAVGAKSYVINKPRHRELWEEKLNQSNISNDDICDALIKKAMEGIKDIPLNPVPLDEIDKAVNNKFTKKTVEEQDTQENSVNGSNINTAGPSKTLKLEIKQAEDTVDDKVKSQDGKFTTNVDDSVKNDKSDISNKKNVNDKVILQTNTFSLDNTTKPKPEPSFNIMDHVSMIKVNGVGVLFQCKICNRNFLNKEVVMSHACAKNRLVKISGPKSFTPLEPAKIPSVKYINTKEFKKSDEKNNEDCEPINLDDDDDEDDKPLIIKKPKPRIGPASKVKRNNTSSPEIASTLVSVDQNLIQVKSVLSSTVQQPTVKFPSQPSLNSRYKLLPGPNNTFTLIEEKGTDNTTLSKNSNSDNVTRIIEPDVAVVDNNTVKNRPIIGPKKIKTASKPLATDDKTKSVNIPNASSNKPYPVGLFKTLPTNTCTNAPIEEPVAFTTPAMKKQSYTVVQTGNPSKLLISSKPQTAVPEVPKKRQRKTKQEAKTDVLNKQPFSVTLEDTTPTRDTEFFTFINVDPLLQPSYVLPTNNIIQESQISTSTSVSKQSEKSKEDSGYTCNMCDESFTREQKLLTHIQSHYSKMDEEDQLRSGRVPRKRKK